MGIVVKKFGGTSVGDVGRIRHVARLVAEYRGNHPDDQIVLVVSAMAGETNRLIALARSTVGNPTPRELDVLLATGEQAAVALVAMALQELGVPARSALAWQAGMFTDDHHLEAHLSHVQADPIARILAHGEIPVVAGFQGVTEDGELTTLGRGGSDISAVALASALGASACYIYTDVPGVLSADPRVCRRARLLSQVCHEEMFELASLGAKVLHPRSVYFAMRYQVPLVVLSSFEPGLGTWIVVEEELMEAPVVRAITHRIDEAKLTMHGLSGGVASVSALFSALADDKILIDMITQTGVEQGRTNVSFTVSDDQSGRALDICRSLVQALGAEGASLERDIAKVSVVGVGMKYHTGVASRMFKTLADERIEIQMIGTSESKISVLIQRKYCELAVRALHEAYLER